MKQCGSTACPGNSPALFLGTPSLPVRTRKLQAEVFWDLPSPARARLGGGDLACQRRWSSAAWKSGRPSLNVTPEAGSRYRIMSPVLPLKLNNTMAV